MYVIEEATIADVPTLVHIAGRTISEPCDAQFLAAMVDLARGSFLVARDTATQAPVGFLLAVKESSVTGRLLLLALDPVYQQHGLGGRLLRELERRLRRTGALECDLEVREDNMRAIAFYHRAGYEIRRAVPRFYSDGGRAILMAKGL